MKAARFYGPGDLRIEEIADPKLSPDGIIMRVELCGVCGTEVHNYHLGAYSYSHGDWGKVPTIPHIMGHEYSGNPSVAQKYVGTTRNALYISTISCHCDVA